MSTRLTVYTDAHHADLLADIALRLDPGATTELYYQAPDVLTSEPMEDVAEGLLWLLRHAGDEWGPLGVALVAARLTDPAVVVATLLDSKTPDVPIPSSPRPTIERGPDRPDEYVGSLLFVDRYRVWTWYGADEGWASHTEWRKR